MFLGSFPQSRLGAGRVNRGSTMLKVTAFLLLLFLALLALRALRLFLAALLGSGSSRRSSSRAIEGEMVRDPVCGVWIDRRLALSAGSGPHAVPVCSEACRQAAESSTRRRAP